MIRIKRVDDRGILPGDRRGQLVDQRIVPAGLGAPRRVDVGHHVGEIPQVEMRAKEICGALHLGSADRRIAAVFTAGHHEHRTRVSTLNARAAEERSDERFVVGMRADPENPLLGMSDSDACREQESEDQLAHARLIRFSRTKRKNR